MDEFRKETRAEESKGIFHIRYVKLHFVLEMLEDCILPKSKPSAIRGGIGEMLLRANCIRGRDCEACDFDSECIVQRTMYSRFEEKPAFITEGDSIGYVIECEDVREEFAAGDRLEFQMLLFGKTIVYFSQYLNAIYALGQSGLGKNGATFGIAEISNSRQEPLLSGSNVLMERYTVEHLDEYIAYRRRYLERRLKEGGRLVLSFRYPVTIKYQGEFLDAFRIDAVLRSLQRRIYILDCFEGIEGYEAYMTNLPLPEVAAEKSYSVSIPRFSFRKDQKMFMKGIKGNLVLEEMDEEELLACLPYLIAGELVHIGKNTSFGFGRYQLSVSTNG